MLIGRHVERGRLEEALDQARLGHGSIVLLGGEAGVGKTRLTTELAAGSDAVVLRGAPAQGGAAPYGPVVAALRSYLRAHPGGLAEVGPLRAQLALLLPELGAPAAAVDRPTLFEAVRCALAHAAAERPALVILDDLHWSDEATLELLSALAEPLSELDVLVIAAYRSDGLPRDHGVRRLRNDLRRTGRLDELVLRPLALEETAELLGAALGGAPSPPLARAIHERTEGLPFFVEELACALQVSGTVQPGRRGLELSADGAVPLPDTVRDAVLISASELSEAARAAAEVAAVAGESFEPELVAALSSDEGLSELVDSGLVREASSGAVAFRHGLTQEALYADVPWMRRRALHRALAEALEAAGAPSREVAKHWLGARASAQAREALLRAAAQSEGVHAHRDAAAADRQALDLWPERGDEERRGETLERYARCSRLAGELAEAARAWRELAALHGAAGDELALARALRELAAVSELKGDREGAFTARRSASAAYVANGRPGEAAVELLAMANQRRLAARHGEAIELAQAARAQAEAAGRLDVRIRAVGLEGMATAKHGDYERGLETVRGGLALALEHDLTVVAAELYQRLSVTLYESGDYPPRRGRARHGAAALPAEPGRRRRGRVRDVHGLRAARARRLGARGRDEPRADRRGHRRLRRRGAARLDPRLRGQAELGAPPAHVRARHRRARRPLQHDGRHHRGARARGGRGGRPRRGRRALPRDPRALGAQRRPPLRGAGHPLGRGLLRRPGRP